MISSWVEPGRFSHSSFGDLMPAPLDLTGHQFGNLTVKLKTNSRCGKTYWICRCTCKAVKEVQGAHLTGGKIRSCGNCTPNRGRTTHGESKTKLYRAWLSMKSRCSPKNAWTRANYYDRGIRVCKRWAKSYLNFRNDMGPTFREGLSLDRIDNDGIYRKRNCRWATRSEQNCNRRRWTRLSKGDKAAR